MKKKIQKLNKYSINIQSIKIDLTWSCRFVALGLTITQAGLNGKQ